jgi:hypothetical protein
MECQTENCNNRAIYAKDSKDFSKSFNFSFIYCCPECYAELNGREFEKR